MMQAIMQDSVDTPALSDSSVSFHREQSYTEAAIALGPPEKKHTTFTPIHVAMLVFMLVIIGAFLFWMFLSGNDKVSLFPGRLQGFQSIPQMTIPDHYNATWGTVDYSDHGGKKLKLFYDVHHPEVRALSFASPSSHRPFSCSGRGHSEARHRT